MSSHQKRILVNKKLARAALVVAMGASALAANASFIDERHGGKGSAASATPFGPGAVLGEFHSAAWHAPIAEAGMGVSVVDALVRLLPAGQPAVEIEGPGSLSDLKVSWEAGATRISVVMAMAKRHGLIMRLSGRSLSIQQAKPQLAVAVGTGAPVGQAAAGQAMPSQPAAKPLHPYEVRLTDIKLSTAINRWAQSAGVRVRWDADKHVMVGAPMTYMKADILEAVIDALDSPGIRNSDYPLEVCEYPNVPRLLRITRKGEQAKDCPEVVAPQRGK